MCNIRYLRLAFLLSSFLHLFTLSFVRSFFHPSTHPPVHPSIHSFVRSFVRSFFHSFFLFSFLLSLILILFVIFTVRAVKLLYANRKDIRIVKKSQRNPNETIVVDGLDDAIAVDFCYAEGYIFWTDVILKKIKRIRFTGHTRKVEDVISVGLKKPEGLAVDWVARKLYWTDVRDSDPERNRIEVANLDGSNRKVLFWKNLGLPRAIAVDPLSG